MHLEEERGWEKSSVLIRIDKTFNPVSEAVSIPVSAGYFSVIQILFQNVWNNLLFEKKKKKELY